MPRRIVLLAALAFVACDDAPEPAWVLDIGGATTSWFEPEPLPLAAGLWGCIGMLELDGEPRLVLASADELVLLRREGASWVSESHALPPAQLDGRVSCTAGELDGEPGLELVIVDRGGGFVMHLDAEGAPELVALPAFPTEWDADPLPLRDAEVGGLALVDLDHDGLLDLYVARTQVGAASLFIAYGCEQPRSGDFQCGQPGVETPGFPDVALRNQGALAFEAFADPPLTLQGQCASSLDLDDDGAQELIVCNDGGFNRVLALEQGAWIDRTSELGLARYTHGMGIALGDLDGDRRSDLAFSDVGTPFVLLRREAGFVAIERERGFGAVLQNAWGVGAEDLDNDGDLDLLFENDIIASAIWASYYCGGLCPNPATPSEELMLYRNDGRGDFTAEWPFRDAVPGPDRGDAMALGDVDGDGLLDALVLRGGVTEGFEPWLLYGRAPAPGHWLEVDAPIGARVEVCGDDGRCQLREVAGGSSYRALASTVLHFGLGPATQADVRVTIAGATQERLDQPSGTRLRFE